MEKLKDKIVLLVDDEARNTFALSSYLRSHDMVIVEAVNGAEAIAVLESGQVIHIILLDMMMPVMDGYETLVYLNHSEQFKHIPVISVTARAMKGDREKCLEAGAWDYISKPIELNILLDKINRWIL